MWIFSHIITTQAERSFGSCFSSISLGDLQSKKGTSVICLAVFNACPFYSILESNQMEGAGGEEEAENCWRRRGGEWLLCDSWRARVRNESLVKPGLRAYMGAKPLPIRRAKNDNNYNGRRKGPLIKVRELGSRSWDECLGPNRARWGNFCQGGLQLNSPSLCHYLEWQDSGKMRS